MGKYPLLKLVVRKRTCMKFDIFPSNKKYFLKDATVIEIDYSNVDQDPCEEKHYWLKQFVLVFLLDLGFKGDVKSRQSLVH